MAQSVLTAIDLAHEDVMDQILLRAKQLADLDRAGLAVITVIPDFGMSIIGSFFDQDVMDKARQTAQGRLHEFTARILGDVASKVQHIVASGNAYEEIIGISEQIDADLIVLGAHSPELKDYLLGPNAARVIRHSKCSVYVVRH